MLSSQPWLVAICDLPEMPWVCAFWAAYIMWDNNMFIFPLLLPFFPLFPAQHSHTPSLHAQYWWWPCALNIQPLSRASPVPPHLKRGSHAKTPSPPDPTLKPSYSQIVKMKIPPRDPGKVTRDLSCDTSPALVTCDFTHDYTQARDPTWSRDPTRFGRATYPLIGTWKTMGINQWSTRSQGIPQGIPHSLSPMDTGTGNILIGLRA